MRDITEQIMTMMNEAFRILFNAFFLKFRDHLFTETVSYNLAVFITTFIFVPT